MTHPAPDPATTSAALWAQACDFLAQERYDLAHQLLEEHFEQATGSLRAHLALYLVSLMSLYAPGDSPEHFDGLQEEMLAGLQEALHADPRLDAQTSADAGNAATDAAPLYLALLAEAQARSYGPLSPAPAEAARFALGSDGPLARYHVVCALSLAGRYNELAAMSPAATELPPHLRWRLRQWQARAEEALGNLSDAASLYADAAHLATGVNRAAMLQEEAALHFQMGELARAAKRLTQARSYYPPYLSDEDQLGLASWHYLQAQLDLASDQNTAALSHIEEAARLEQQYGEDQAGASYGVALVWGQILSALGHTEQALSHFEEALRRAAPEDAPYAHHELGVALLDLDRPLEAREHLERTLEAPDYPFAAEVLADIAECDYRLGRLKEAQEEAENAMQQGATVPASLVLGSIAMEYYHLDDALGHYQRVTREAAPASRDWVVGHQMAADILAQQGFSDPAAIYAHAQQALEHTDPSDEWYGTLEEHLQKAAALMGGGSGRTLN